MKKIIFVTIIAFFLIHIHPLGVATAAEKGGNIIVCQPAEPPGLDPTANTAAAIDRVVFSNIYEGLVKIDRGGNYIPGLAESWDVSPDGKVYTFKLRRNVQFHNGAPFDANVAKWNIDRARF